MYQEGEKGFIKLLGQPDSGEYAEQTRFLDPEANDGEDIMRRISFDYLDSMTALFLLTDGMGAFPKSRNIVFFLPEYFCKASD